MLSTQASEQSHGEFIVAGFFTASQQCGSMVESKTYKVVIGRGLGLVGQHGADVLTFDVESVASWWGVSAPLPKFGHD